MTVDIKLSLTCSLLKLLLVSTLQQLQQERLHTRIPIQDAVAPRPMPLVKELSH